MSKITGARLPDAILRALDGTDLRDKIGPAHLLVTSDADGMPRPCMLSAGEILVVDERRYRVALWPGSHTCENLARGSGVLLCYVEEGLAVYAKGHARVLPPIHGVRLERFEVRVEHVESDVHGGMPVAGPITFTLAGPDPGEVVRDWGRQIEALRVDSAGPA